MIDGEQTNGPAIAPAIVRRIATICNKYGLHARAAAKIVKTAAQFDADVRVRKNGTEASGRDLLELLLLDAPLGTALELTASGPQAAEAIAALANLIECKFHESR